METADECGTETEIGVRADMERKTRESALPYFERGEVVKGFGRGSKEIGVPTGTLLLASSKLPKLATFTSDATAICDTVCCTFTYHT